MLSLYQSLLLCVPCRWYKCAVVLMPAAHRAQNCWGRTLGQPFLPPSSLFTAVCLTNVLIFCVCWNLKKVGKHWSVLTGVFSKD